MIRQKKIKTSEILAVLHYRSNTSALAIRTLGQGNQNTKGGRLSPKWEVSCAFQFSLSSDTRQESFFNHGHQGLLPFTPGFKSSIPSMPASVTSNSQIFSPLATVALFSLKCYPGWVSQCTSFISTHMCEHVNSVRTSCQGDLTMVFL